MTTKKQDKTKIIQIWGDILDEGFTSVPNILLRYRNHLNIKPKHLTLIIDIMSFKWDSGNPYPSYSTLATRAGMEERSIKRTMQELEELNLLKRTPRFDENSGAQITTIFDFRPLVKKLIEEKNKSGDRNVTGRVTEMSPGGMTEMSQGGVTEMSQGGVTEMSPKEYKYINKNNSVNNPIKKREGMTILAKESKKNINKKDFERVRKELRNSIYRNRLFEVYDNLYDKMKTEDLVEEGALKALKDLLINKVNDMKKYESLIDPQEISMKVKKVFPYDKLPLKKIDARKFYVAKVCDITTKEVMSTFIKN